MDTLKDSLQCSICLNLLYSPISTQCGHNFCEICINQVVELSFYPKCPLCRERIVPGFHVNKLLELAIKQNCPEDYKSWEDHALSQRSHSCAQLSIKRIQKLGRTALLLLLPFVIGGLLSRNTNRIPDILLAVSRWVLESGPTSYRERILLAILQLLFSYVSTLRSMSFNILV